MDKKIVVTLVTILLVLPVLVARGVGVVNAETIPKTQSSDGWKTLKTDVATILLPANGSKPFFLWSYNSDPNVTYFVRFNGLTEHFTFNTSYYFHQYAANASTLGQLIEGELTNPRGLFRMSPLRNLILLRQVISQIVIAWGHPAGLFFSNCKWTMQQVSNITADNGKIIGSTFTFNLTDAPRPFTFAVNNIAIRVRLYNTTVNEKVNAPNGTTIYSYNVGINEMKMDLVVQNWKWNLDLVEPLLTALNSSGVNIPETKTAIALGIDLASINRTSLQQALKGPAKEEIEALSTCRQINIDSSPVELSSNIDGQDETPINLSKRLDDDYDLQFASANKSLAGFFKFIASASITNKSGSYKVPVKASYITRGASMRVYISYPRFNGTLSHDPSIGVDTVGSSTATPQYEVTVGGTLTAQLISGLLGTESILLTAVVVASIATIIVAGRWTRRRYLGNA